MNICQEERSLCGTFLFSLSHRYYRIYLKRVNINQQETSKTRHFPISILVDGNHLENYEALVFSWFSEDRISVGDKVKRKSKVEGSFFEKFD